MSTYRRKYPQGYYVYAYIRNTDSKNGKSGTPYYIGKGYKKRAWNDHGHIVVPKDKACIHIIKQNLDSYEAYDLEIRLIRWYGRIDRNTGILHNRTNGGPGISHLSNRTREHIKYLSNIRYSTIENRELHRRAIIDYYNQNPEMRDYQRQISLEYWSDLNNRKKASQVAKDLWLDDEFRNKAVAGAIRREKNKSDEERRAISLKISEANRKRFQNQDVRDDQSKKLIAYHESHPELREYQREKRKKYYIDNPLARQNIGNHARQRYSDPEVRKQASDQMKAIQASVTPEQREAREKKRLESRARNKLEKGLLK